MTSAAKGLFHRFGSSCEDVGIAAHISWDQHRLANLLVRIWNFGMTGSEGSCRAFAMNAHFSLLAIDRMRLDLRNVVGDLIHGAQADVLLASIQCFSEGRSRPLGDHLAIGKRVIDRATHRTQVPL